MAEPLRTVRVVHLVVREPFGRYSVGDIIDGKAEMHAVAHSPDNQKVACIVSPDPPDGTLYEARLDPVGRA